MPTATSLGPGDPPVLVGSSAGITVTHDGTTIVTTQMRAPRPTDAPILLTVSQPLAAA